MVLPDRNEKGRFVKGNHGGPGRPRREVEEEYRNVFTRIVTIKDWEDIISRAVRDAKRGDTSARKFLADYIIGPPIERKELTGLDGGPLEIKGYVSISPDDWDKQPTINSDL